MISDLRFQTNKTRSGFTLIEVLVSIGILILLGSTGLFIGFDFYKTYALNAERDMLVSALQRARNLSMNNINNQPHGIYFEKNKYTAFQGLYFNLNDSRNQIFKAMPGIEYIVQQPEIIFNQMSGNLNFDENINLLTGSKSLNIGINSYGQINW